MSPLYRSNYKILSKSYKVYSSMLYLCLRKLNMGIKLGLYIQFRALLCPSFVYCIDLSFRLFVRLSVSVSLCLCLSLCLSLSLSPSLSLSLSLPLSLSLSLSLFLSLFEIFCLSISLARYGEGINQSITQKYTLQY